MAKRPSEHPGGPGAKPSLTWEKFQQVCATLEVTGLKYKACELNGFRYTTVENAIKSQLAIGDGEWETLWRESFDKYRESLVNEARSRAVDGWDEPVYHMGKLVGTVNKKSDRLLELMVTRQVPEFAPNSTVHLVNHDEHGMSVFKDLSLDAKKRIRQIIMEDLDAQRLARAERVEVQQQQLEGPAS